MGDEGRDADAESKGGTRKVEWAEEALRDLNSLRAYLSPRDPAAATRIAARILTSIESLQSTPFLGRTGRVAGTRERIVYRTPYVVAYRPTKDAIQVLAVVHGKRKWPRSFAGSPKRRRAK